MTHYVGIDLGTTNSAISSFDGAQTRIWKSPEQNDVTPSAIFISSRGNILVGRRPYEKAPHSPGNTATLFKRLMGTNTSIELPAVGRTMKPEECSAEVLRVLFGYMLEQLPSSDSIAGTVITVPAAFNTMQKSATRDAAEMAGIGRVALMQEPVAAVMSVMKARDVDGTFVIYDLGGGTLDVTVAQSIQREISILATGGIQMCGGRDFDRTLVDNVVKPWLFREFDLPHNWSQHEHYKKLFRIAAWAAERAKIELSSKEATSIQVDEMDLDVQDQSGREVHIDIPLTRDAVNKLIEQRVDASVDATREVLKDAGVTSHDVECLVFVGGPTNYKPLRDKVTFELGVSASTDVNPMTAVAEGAAIFTESVDWQSEKRTRKSGHGKLSSTGPVKVTFHYTTRTPERASVLVRVEGQSPLGAEFQVRGLDDGWSSGRTPLADDTTVDVPLSRSGPSRFKVSIFGVPDNLLTLEDDVITVTKTAATVDAIPVSHSVGVGVRTEAGGSLRMKWLVRKSDMLPNKGTAKFRAAETLTAGSGNALNFKIYEGESNDPEDNRLIGVMSVRGTDLEHGVIRAGADLICDYEMDDSGGVRLEVSVPSIGAAFRSDRNFYSRESGQVDFADASKSVTDEREMVLERLNEIEEHVVDDPRLAQVRQRLETAERLDSNEDDLERVQEAWEAIADARRLIAHIRNDHAGPIRRMEFKGEVAFFDDHLRELATPMEQRTFDNLRVSAQRAVDSDGDEFETYMNEMRGNNFSILWRDDSYVIELFKMFSTEPHRTSDRTQFSQLVETGVTLMQGDDIDALRQIVAQLAQLRRHAVSNADLSAAINIIGG